MFQLDRTIQIRLKLTLDCGITPSASARCRRGDGLDSSPKLRHTANDVKICACCCYIKCTKLIKPEVEMPFPKAVKANNYQI